MSHSPRRSGDRTGLEEAHGPWALGSLPLIVDGPARLRDLIKALLACPRGIAMAEFALVVPIIALIYLGSIIAYDAIRAERQVGATADSIADLISRESTIDDDFRDTLFQAAEALMGRFSDAATLGVAITSLGNDGGVIRVLWSEANKNAQTLSEEDLDKLAGLPTIPENESIILVSVGTAYAPLLLQAASPPFNLSETVIARPRFVPQIIYQ